MPNQTLLQKVKSRITLLNAKKHLDVPDSNFNIYKISGEDELGKPYAYQVTFVSPVKLQIEDIVDTDVKVLLKDQKDHTHTRDVFGKVFSAVVKDKIGDKFIYQLQIVHPLYYLNLNKRYEIFQEKSAYEIIKEILDRYKETYL